MSYQQIPSQQSQQQPPIANGHGNYPNTDLMSQMNTKINSQFWPQPVTAGFNQNLQQQTVNQQINKYPAQQQKLPPQQQLQQQQSQQQQQPQQQYQQSAYLASQANRQMMLSNGNSATSSRTSSPGLSTTSNHNNSNSPLNSRTMINNKPNGGTIPVSQLPPMQNNNVQYPPMTAQSMPQFASQVSNSNSQGGTNISSLSSSKSMPVVQHAVNNNASQQINHSIPNLTNNLNNINLNNGQQQMRPLNGQNYNNNLPNSNSNPSLRSTLTGSTQNLIPSNQLPPTSQLPIQPPTNQQQPIQQPQPRMLSPQSNYPQQQFSVNQQQPPPPQQQSNQQRAQSPLATQHNYLQQMAQPTPTPSAFNKRPMYPNQNSNNNQPNQLHQQHQLQQQIQQPQLQTQQPQQMQQPNIYNGQNNSGFQQNQQYPNQYNNSTINSQFSNPALTTQSGFNRLWGNETVDLLQNRHILPTEKVKPPPIKLNHHFHEAINCNPE